MKKKQPARPPKKLTKTEALEELFQWLADWYDEGGSFDDEENLRLRQGYADVWSKSPELRAYYSLLADKRNKDAQ